MSAGLNIPLALELYGGGIWCTDARTLTIFSKILSDFRSNVPFSAGEKEKANSFCYVGVESRQRFVTTNAETETTEEEKVSVIFLNGPITKNGGMSSYGTKELSDMLVKADNNSNVIGHVIVADSGGGAASAMKIMQNTLDSLKKPKAAVIERGGMAGSAAYGIIAHTDRIFAEDGDAEAGSIGTMISFAAQPKGVTNANGEKQVTIYATNSTNKNKWFEEALNNDNYQIAIDEILDPHEEEFRADMKKQRPGLKDEHTNGTVLKAKDSIGTFVDEIGGLKDAINFVKTKSSTNLGPNLKQKQKQINNNSMTAAEIQSQFPEAYSAIHSAGVAAESSRTKVWLAHHGTDPKAVVAGIKSGEKLSDEQREELLVAANGKRNLDALQSDSAKDVVPGEAENEGGDKKLSKDQKDFESTFSKYKISLPDHVK